MKKWTPHTVCFVAITLTVCIICIAIEFGIVSRSGPEDVKDSRNLLDSKLSLIIGILGTLLGVGRRISDKPDPPDPPEPKP